MTASPSDASPTLCLSSVISTKSLDNGDSQTLSQVQLCHFFETMEPFFGKPTAEDEEFAALYAENLDMSEQEVEELITVRKCAQL